MSIIKVKKTAHYAQIENTPLQTLEKLEAIGLMGHLMSLPSDWTIQKVQLQNKFGRAAVTKGFDELEGKGYVLSIKYRKGKSNFWDYTIRDIPFSREEVLDTLKDIEYNILEIKGLHSSIVENQQLKMKCSKSTTSKEIKKKEKSTKEISNTTTTTLAEAKQFAYNYLIDNLKYEKNFDKIYNKIDKFLKVAPFSEIENYVDRLIEEHDKKPREVKTKTKVKPIRSEIVPDWLPHNPLFDDELKKDETSINEERKRLEKELEMFKNRRNLI